MKTIAKLNVVPFARFQATLAMLLGVAAGFLYAFGGLAIDILVSIGMLSPTTYGTPGLSYGTVLAFGALVGMPLIGFIFGFIAGVCEALFYNLYVKWFPPLTLNI